MPVTDYYLILNREEVYRVIHNLPEHEVGSWLIAQTNAVSVADTLNEQFDPDAGPAAERAVASNQQKHILVFTAANRTLPRPTYGLVFGGRQDIIRRLNVLLRHAETNFLTPDSYVRLNGDERVTTGSDIVQVTLPDTSR